MTTKTYEVRRRNGELLAVIEATSQETADRCAAFEFGTDRYAEERQIHESLTPAIIDEAIEARILRFGGFGFCLSCGTEHDECFEDLENGECMDCGAKAVFSAERIKDMI